MPSLSLDERIKRDTQKLEQLKAQKRAQEAREKQKERAVDTRLKIIAGGTFLAHFPQFKTLKPQKTNAENLKEFEPLADFFACLAEKKPWVSQLEAEARQKAENREKVHAPPIIQQGADNSES
ncbi:MAG: hypothetical protein FWD48_11195 [Oscillospiraceae bacterium]|nr:hypothetical protein [Oscillospiraceae bacterium]